LKPVLAWIKANLLIVIFSLVILAVLPAAYFVSSAWGNSVRKEQADKAGKELSRIKGAMVDYSIPAYEAGAQPVSFKSEPNARITEWFKARREELAKQAGEIFTRAVEFNQGKGPDAAAVWRTEHRPLIPGLFPKPAPDQAQPLIYAFEDSILGKRGSVTPYQQLLDSIGAGQRADVLRLSEIITDLRNREAEKITVQKRELTPAEHADLEKQLTERRLAEYQNHARTFSVYASKDIFPTDTRAGVSIATGDSLLPAELNPDRLFLYQWDLWVLSDLLGAVRVANAGPDGRPLPVEQSVVKRILSIGLADPEGIIQNNDAMPDAFAAAPAAPATPGLVPLDPTRSITGRGSGPNNTVYDVRRGSITAIVASDRVPEFLSAIERTNFMTVTGLEVSTVNIWEDLKEGYYYGTEHVVQVKVEIESVWLRAWMAPLVPDGIKSLLQFPDAPPPPEGADPAASGGAAPMAPPGRGGKGRG